jgi:hypothetical protein
MAFVLLEIPKIIIFWKNTYLSWVIVNILSLLIIYFTPLSSKLRKLDKEE